MEIQRIRKDSETMSNAGGSTISRIRRESDRFRTDNAMSDVGSVSGQRPQPAIREVIQRKFYALKRFSFLENKNLSPTTICESSQRTWLHF